MKYTKEDEEDAVYFGNCFRKNQIKEGRIYFERKIRRTVWAALFSTPLFGKKIKEHYISASIYECRLALIHGKWNKKKAKMKFILNFFKGFLKNHPALKAEILHNLGELYFYLGDFQKAIHYTEQAKEIKENCKKKYTREEELKPNLIALGQSSIVIGKGYWRRGNFSEALLHYFEAIFYYFLANNKKESYLSSRALCLIGQVYIDLNELSKAKKFLERAIKTLKEFLPDDHHYLGAAYNELGRCYLLEYKDYIEAKKYFNSAQKILDGSFKDISHRYKASVLGNIAELYWEMAKDALEQSFSIEEKKILLSNFQAELEIRKEAFKGRSHPSVAKAFNKISKVHYELNNYQKAVENANYALEEAIPKFRAKKIFDVPSIKSIKTVQSLSILLQSLEYKGRAFIEMVKIQSQGQLNEEELLRGWKILKRALDVIDEIRDNFFSDESRLVWNKEARSVIELSIEILYQLRKKAIELGNKREEKIWNEKIFQIFQKSKASLLLESIQNPSKKRILRSLEKEDNHNPLQNIERKIFENSPFNIIEKDFNKLTRFLKNRRKNLESELDRIKEDVQYLEQGHLQKDNSETIPNLTLENLWNEFDNKHEEGLIVSYLVGEENLYAILISGKWKSFNIIKLHYNEKIDGRPRLRRIIKEIVEVFNEYQGDFRGIDSNSKKEFIGNKDQELKLLLSINGLYEFLIAPLSFGDAKRLYIIPDDFLTFLPFGILSPKINSFPEFHYHQLEYLVKKYKISYHASIAILYFNHRALQPNEENFINENLINGKKHEKAFPPRKLLSVSTGTLIDGHFKREVNQTLEDGVRKVAKILGINEDRRHHIILKRNLLTKKRIIMEMGRANVIHFLAHSKAKEEDRNNISLILQEIFDKKRDKKIWTLLNQEEIAKCSINAELVLLNTCRGGGGKLAEGEGSMALNRAFLRAGCRNIYFNFFRIKTGIAIDMASLFIEKLWKDEMCYVDALHHCKLEQIKQPETAHPAFWAAPAFIGDQMGKLTLK